MPVPNSIAIVDDSEWEIAPHIPFKRKASFDHFGNILNMIRGGGCLRGLLAHRGAGCFEVMSKRELQEENGDVKIGRGRKVPSHTIKQMIQRREIFVVPGDGNVGGVVLAEATVVELFTEGFPRGWGVQDTPFLNSSMLYKSNGDSLAEICRRPDLISIERWVPIARAMAFGASSLVMEPAA